MLLRRLRRRWHFLGGFLLGSAGAAAALAYVMRLPKDPGEFYLAGFVSGSLAGGIVGCIFLLVFAALIPDEPKAGENPDF